jgi:hypothetical protein
MIIVLLRDVPIKLFLRHPTGTADLQSAQAAKICAGIIETRRRAQQLNTMSI